MYNTNNKFIKMKKIYFLIPVYQILALMALWAGNAIKNIFVYGLLVPVGKGDKAAQPSLKVKRLRRVVT